MALIYNASFDSTTRVLSLLDKAGNVISSCEVPSKELVDDPNKPLMLRSLENASTVMLKKKGTLSNTYQISKNGTDWTDYTFGNEFILNNEDVIYFRCSNHPTTQSDSNYVFFSMTGKIEAWHNAYSMISSSFTSAEGSVGNYGMCRLFTNCSSLAKAPLLPSTTLEKNCYAVMFFGCRSLTQAPLLPATTLADYCYHNMFMGCSSLEEVRISATTTAYRALDGWLYNVSATGDFYCDPNASLTNGDSGIPYRWNRWVYGAEDTGTTTTMYHNGTTETVKVGTSSYGACYALQGWVGFKSLAQMHDLRYVLQEPVPTTMYHNGSTETIGKIEANGADGFTEDMYILNSSFKTLSEMHVIGYTLGAQTPITMYGYEDPISAYSCASNTGDGFAETMYDIDDEMGYQTITQQNEKGFYLTITTYGGLTLTATADNSSVSARLDKSTTKPGVHSVEVHTGRGWRGLVLGSDVIKLNIGDKCRCRALSKNSLYDYIVFSIKGAVEASGNVHSMIDKDFDNTNTVTKYGYYRLFNNCTGLTKAPELPATTLAEYCYRDMFSGCTGLTQAPVLPATTLAPKCYTGMFSGCTGLTQAPQLPATTLADNCYSGMFSGCTGLTQAPVLPATTLEYRCYVEMFKNCSSLVQSPELPATTLADNCYQSMFNGCTSLTQAPNLPATTLAGYCYQSMFNGCTTLAQAPDLPVTRLSKSCYDSMFSGCTALTQAPQLPATTLADNCYQSMFKGCTALTQAPNLPATTLANYCYQSMFENCSVLAEVRIAATTTASDALKNWLTGVAASGTVYADPSFTGLPENSASGVPSGWVRAPLSDYPVTP